MHARPYGLQLSGQACLPTACGTGSALAAAGHMDPPLTETGKPPLDAMRTEARGCVRCRLSETRTQVVVGDGNPGAVLMLVGEGPGAQEDEAGRPFVGRSGKLLDEALREAGISRGDLYITNTVRCRPVEIDGGRFRNRPPKADETRACAVWMTSELELVDPRVVACIGGAAAKALIGRDFKITRHRGELIPGKDGRQYIATYHPSYLLRLRSADPAAYEAARAAFASDLKAAYEVAAG